MAITLADAVVKITADDSPVAGVFGRVRTQANSLVGGLGRAAMIGTGAILGTGLAVVTTIGRAAVGISSEVDTATKKLQAQLGLTDAQAQMMGDSIANVYANNFGESIEDVGESIATVDQQMNRFGTMTQAELEASTEAALALRDAFEVDIGESTNAANALMENFNLTSQEAFDFIATGMQQGLNNSGDFLDTIGEYSNQFAAAGFDAANFFSIMDTGLQAGVLGTDKIADAVKEMNIKLAEGGPAVEDAFDMLGMNYQEIAGFVASGDEAWADYFDQIVTGLAGIDDPLARATAQTAIFGTMAEDLGVSFTDGLSAGTASLETMIGATGTLNTQYETLPDAVEGFRRRAEVALIPVGDKILELANEHMPEIESAFAWFEQTAPIWIETGVTALVKFADHMRTVVIPAATQLGIIAAIYLQKASTAATQLSIMAGIAFDALKAKFNEVKDNIINGIEAWKGVFENAGTAWQTIWGNVSGAVQGAWSAISPIFDSIKGFADWLSSTVFSFDFSLPQIPDYFIPGSPTPFEMGIRGIDDALANMRTGMAATMGQLAPAPSYAFSSSDQFNFTVANQSDAELAANLINQSRRQQMRDFMNR